MASFPVRACVALALAVTLPSAAAAPLVGTRTLVLSNAAGEREVLGTVDFRDAGDGRTAFEVQMDTRLGEHFLAMRPFRCLTGARQRLCWYPVRVEPASIRDDDLAPLEYALMFMKSAPGALHLDPVDGVYYRLERTADGLRGQAFDLDMDPFINPAGVPPERRARPVGAAQLEVADPASHWLPVLTIE
ncbi:MAG: hypothetical protein MUF30_10935 [Burkholderiales bacterium]|jgi:hypothetical protein|nr:hypothetical protein [Burkholderiales bacterium]